MFSVVCAENWKPVETSVVETRGSTVVNRLHIKRSTQNLPNCGTSGIANSNGSSINTLCCHRSVFKLRSDLFSGQGFVVLILSTLKEDWVGSAFHLELIPHMRCSSIHQKSTRGLKIAENLRNKWAYRVFIEDKRIQYNTIYYRGTYPPHLGICYCFKVETSCIYTYVIPLAHYEIGAFGDGFHRFSHMPWHLNLLILYLFYFGFLVNETASSTNSSYETQKQTKPRESVPIGYKC